MEVSAPADAAWTAGDGATGRSAATAGSGCALDPAGLTEAGAREALDIGAIDAPGPDTLEGRAIGGAAAVA